MTPHTPLELYSTPASHTGSTAPTVRKRNPLDPEDVFLSPAWATLAGLSALVGLALMRRFGWLGALVTGAVGAVVGLYATLVEPRWPVLERHELWIADLPAHLDGLRIGQISDIHLGMPAAAHNLRWAVAQMKREQPDVLVFTGDFIHRRVAQTELPTLLAGIAAPLGMYGVGGNHDGWESGGVLRDTLAAGGITLLVNEHRRLEWNSGEFFVVGLDDVWDGSPALEGALDGVPLSAFALLLAHTPHDAATAAKLGIDVQLSGHTHGGHMVLPLLGPIARPRYTGRFLSGMFQVGRMTLYVSRGLGGAPLRLACRPEAAIFTLRRT